MVPTEYPTDVPSEVPTIGDPDAETRNGEGDICQTAFAHDPTTGDCFLSHGFDRWGWTIGGLTFGLHKYNMYMGAGGCDPSTGTIVGELILSYNSNGHADVLYTAGEGYRFDETHLYIGSDPFPDDNSGNPTVDPIHYTGKHGVCQDPKSDEYGFSHIIPDEYGEIYIIAHTVACRE